MGVFSGSARESRAFGTLPSIPPNSETGSFFGSRRVDLTRTESSLQKVAVYASVRLLREVVTMLPLDTYTSEAGEPKQITTPRWLEDPSGDGYGLADWCGQVVYSDAMRGNVVARIASRDTRSGLPRQLPLVHPDDVSVHRNDDGRAEWHLGGTRVPAEDVWHKRSFPIPGNLWGLSPIGAHALTVGQGLAAAQFGVQWFLDGAHPSAILQNDNNDEIPQATARAIKDRFLSAIRGTREPVVLSGGWKYQQIQVAPGESQFLETQKYTSAECARIFGPGMPEMLGYETGGSLTYANIEQRSLDLLTYTLDPWLVRLERMVTDLLPRPQYVKFNRAALLRTDMLTRFKVHEIALRNKVETVNEVRHIEDMPPVAWGAEPTADLSLPPVPVQMEQ